MTDGQFCTRSACSACTNTVRGVCVLVTSYLGGSDGQSHRGAKLTHGQFCTMCTCRCVYAFRSGQTGFMSDARTPVNGRARIWNAHCLSGNSLAVCVAAQCIRPTRAPARSRLPGLSPTDQGRMPRRTKVCAGHASLALPYQHYGLVEHVAQLRLQAVGDVVYHLGYLGLGLGHVGHELVEYGEG